MPLSVLPVLDLKNGQVVHARAGVRSHYRPLVSRWCCNADDPLVLADALHRRFNSNEYYVADLDALEGRAPQYELITQLMEKGCQLWLDAGIRSTSEVKAWFNRGVHRIMVASETLPSVSLLHDLFQSSDSNRLVYSLDLFRGKLRSLPEVFTCEEPMIHIDMVAELGCQAFVILDTADVGVSLGPTTQQLCKQVRERHPDCVIISGGGVRNTMDILDMENHGVDRVLVSTWLHQGCP